MPAVYLATTGETITALQHNSPLSDIAADLNAPRPVTTGGTGANTVSGARANLSVYSRAEVDAAISGGFPASAIDGNFASFDGSDGDTLKDSGKSSASFATAAQGALADGAAQATDLASTSASKGASLVGVQDSAANFTATTVEAVLAEIAAKITTAAIGEALAAVPFGNVGTIAMVRFNSGANPGPGGTTAGSNLKYTSASANDASSPVPTGTWRLMGNIAATGGSSGSISLAQRIA